MSGQFAIDIPDGDNDQLLFWQMIARELQNPELFSLVFDFAGRPISRDNVCDLLAAEQELGLDCSRELGYVSAHFEEISESAFSALSIDQLYQIMSHPDFKISNEDFLYSLVSRSFRSDSQYFSLLEFVHFENLSCEKVHEFVEEGFRFLPHLNIRIWARIAERLLSRSDQKQPKRNTPRMSRRSTSKCSSRICLGRPGRRWSARR